MRLNSKLTGGLAWAGLILVLAVPSADMLTKSGGNSAAHLTSDMDAVKTAGVAPTTETAIAEPRVIIARPGEEPVVVQAASEDPVEEYLNSGRKLPSYISDAPPEVASKEPAPVTKLVVPDTPPASIPALNPIEVATVAAETPVTNAALMAPMPYPVSMRPAPPVVTATVSPPAIEEEPLIVDEDLVARREAAVAAVLGSEPVDPYGSDIVSGDELEEWDSGSLAEYLERRGLMSRGTDEASGNFDEDGFFLDEGPDGRDERLLRRRLRREFIFF